MIKLEDIVDFTPQQKKELEDFIIKRLEDIIFTKKRPSGRAKTKGYKTKTVKGKVVSREPIFSNSFTIDDNTGNLRKTLKANKGFLRIDKKGLVFDIKMVSYFKYLDDQRRDELNWYLSEGFFEDEEVIKKLRTITAEGLKGKFLEIISQELKQN